ncbi:MAG: hypothetical protein P8098_20355 [Candidatus Thiodiazotropha sp.]
MLKIWLYGLAISLVGGLIVAGFYRFVLEKALRTSKPIQEAKRFPGWLLGIMERLFFTILIATNATAVVPAMMGWLAIKMAINWSNSKKDYSEEGKLLAFIGVTTGLVSLALAYIGGVYIKCAIP